MFCLALRDVPVQVSDPCKPMFLYIYHCGLEVFTKLKEEQSLLVEFSVFPSKVVELIRRCFVEIDRKQMFEMHLNEKREVGGAVSCRFAGWFLFLLVMKVLCGSNFVFLRSMIGGLGLGADDIGAE